MKRILLLLLLAASLPALAQTNQPDTLTTPKSLDEVTIFSGKFAEKLKRTTGQISILRSSHPWAFNNPNMADVLQNSGLLFVQKSQQGGGSPVIRGFEASRVLLMVDGIRMNNAIYRAGHLQNLITVDPNIVDRVEIIYGPSSTLYGSDALGGVLNMYTKTPTTSSGKTQLTGNLLTRYASAINEFTGHADVNISGKNWGSFTSFTYSSFGDIIQGKNRNSQYPDFGKKPLLVQTTNGIDYAIPNPKPDQQSPSGYNQYDLMQKFLFRPSERASHIINLQVSRSSDIPRYDRLSELSAGKPRFSEWYYGPQKRSLAAWHFNYNNKKSFFSQVSTVVSFQNLEESRFNRRFGSKIRQERRENINVWGGTADFKHTAGNNELHIGTDLQINDLKSTAQGVQIVTGATSRLDSRYPDGTNLMSSWAIYLQHTYKINERITLSEGIRLNTINLSSTFVDTAILSLPYTEAKQKKTAVTGNIGLVYASPTNWRLALLLNSGFRTPNFDDLSRVFESAPQTLIVPNTELGPEYTYNAELNFNKVSGPLNLGGGIFYTLFRDAIVLDQFQFNGQDSVIYQGVRSGVRANQNKKKAFLYGANINGRYSFNGGFAMDGAITYTYGRVQDPDGQIPLDHIPPVYARLAFSYTQKRVSAEIFSLFNAWKRLKEYNPNGEDNGQYATADGMPAWFTINIRGFYQLNPQLRLQLAVENLLDRNYRTFASGISAPGRNFVMTIKAGF